MRIKDIEVKFDIESTCKICCRNTDCVHNMINDRRCEDILCNLKHVELDENGRCMCFAERIKTNEC